MASQVLSQITIETKLPPPETACQDCQHATWMEFKEGVKCYCSVTMAFMYMKYMKETQIVWACDKQMSMEETETTELIPQSKTQAPGQIEVIQREVVATTSVSLMADLEAAPPKQANNENQFFNHQA